jgi:hypothetical protein
MLPRLLAQIARTFGIKFSRNKSKAATCQVDIETFYVPMLP